MIGGSDQFASAAVTSLGSQLDQMLRANEEIVPGSAPSYELCKTIFAYHPLGAILATAPITRAMARGREINVPVLAEERLVKQFLAVARTIGRVGEDVLINRLMSISRIYGIATIGIGEVNRSPSDPLDSADLGGREVYFSIFDPLNTAGSLVLNQDPNSPDFLKPNSLVAVNGQTWHHSRLCVKMNEEPLYIEWTNSAFGFVGRSVYQRAIFPLRTFLQTMITDQMVTEKAGLLVAKLQAPGSFIDSVMQGMFQQKRLQIKSGTTNQVLQIGVEEAIETLNMMNLDKAANFARTNVLKNIASAAGMPASIIAQETLTEGFGEGTEDAKREAAYIDFLRNDMAEAYAFLDRIVMRKAWSRDFFETLQRDYPEYERMGYESALAEWMDTFTATWPNAIEEPASEKSKTADVQFKAVVALVETIGPLLDGQNRANLMQWVAENVNQRSELFSGSLDLDIDQLAEFAEQQNRDQTSDPAMKEVHEPRPFTAAS